MQIDLMYCIPEKLAETVSIGDLTDTVLQIADWEERQAEVLDYIYRQRLIRLISTARRGEETAEELRTFSAHLDKATHPARINKLDRLDKPYGTRWNAYLDILQSRLAALESDVPDQVMKLKNIREIMDMILDFGTVGRKDIQNKFKLKSANLTRILNIMEASDLISSRTVGREKLISAGSNGSAYRIESVSGNSETKRWAACLRMDEAA